MEKTNESWYNILIEDIKLQESTGIVATKHAIGKRILEDFEKFGKNEFGKKTVRELAKDSDMSKSDIANCIRFARKYPDGLSNDVGQLSWHQIANNILPEHKEEKVPKEDWFEQHTGSDVEAFVLKSIITIQRKIEKQYGVVYLNEFSETVQRILELGVTHINYIETWKQE